MSDTFQLDPYLVSQKLPSQPDGYGEVIEIKRRNQPNIIDKHILLMTPVGLFLSINADEPRVFGNKEADEDNKPVFGMSLGFAVTNENMLVRDIDKAINLMANTTWPRVQIPHPNDLNRTIEVTGSELLEMGMLNTPLNDGNDEYRRDFKKNAAYRGLWYIRAKAFPTDMQGKSTPMYCQDSTGKEIPATEFYSGCYGRAVIKVKTYIHPRGGKGVNLHFTAVQLAAKGKPLFGFDRKAAARDAFAAAGPISLGNLPAPQAMDYAKAAQQPDYTQPGWNPGTPVEGFPEPMPVAAFQPPNPQPLTQPRRARPPGT